MHGEQREEGHGEKAILMYEYLRYLRTVQCGGTWYRDLAFISLLFIHLDHHVSARNNSVLVYMTGH